MENNVFELTGKINYINVKATDGGTMITRILLSKKIKEDLYNTFSITCFNEVAEKAGDNFKKGDYVHIKGYISENKFKKDEKDKSIIADLIASEVRPVEYDTKEKSYVFTDDKTEDKPW